MDGESAVDKKSSQEHREFSRVDIKVHVRVLAKDRDEISKDTHDISMKGLFLSCQEEWPIGTECEVHLLLEGQASPIDLFLKGRVQRITEEGMGILFTEVSLEAYEHLHNLILFNSHNPDKVDQEFKDHLGLKKK